MRVMEATGWTYKECEALISKAWGRHLVRAHISHMGKSSLTSRGWYRLTPLAFSAKVPKAATDNWLTPAQRRQKARKEAYSQMALRRSLKTIPTQKTVN